MHLVLLHFLFEKKGTFAHPKLLHDFGGANLKVLN